jgi:hypothetical protein
MPIDRRAFLGALALAPAALAGCATGAARAGSTGGEPSALPAVQPTPAPGSAGGALAAVREFPLDAGVEPALVFRAAAARP